MGTAFLANDKIKEGVNSVHKRAFLLEKGLTEGEIAEAMGRVARGAVGPVGEAGIGGSGGGRQTFVYPPPAYVVEPKRGGQCLGKNDLISPTPHNRFGKNDLGPAFSDRYGGTRGMESGIADGQATWWLCSQNPTEKGLGGG